MVIHGPKGWTHQQSPSRKLHRPHAHGLTKSFKSMSVDPQNGRPSTPTGSIASGSMTAGSIVSSTTYSSATEHSSPPPKHQDSTDSTDSWDIVEDLPLRWATDYVNLATAGSKLSNTQVLFFELWKNEGYGSRGTSMLAVATKACILLYETPKNERSFRFVKVCHMCLAGDWSTDVYLGVLYTFARKVYQLCTTNVHRSYQSKLCLSRGRKTEERAPHIETGTRKPVNQKSTRKKDINTG